MEFIPKIRIKEGNFSFRDIATVADAADFLHAWPHDKRNPFFYLAENAMQLAINGSLQADEARETFRTFCSEAGILAEDPSSD